MVLMCRLPLHDIATMRTLLAREEYLFVGTIGVVAGPCVAPRIFNKWVETRHCKRMTCFAKHVSSRHVCVWTAYTFMGATMGVDPQCWGYTPIGAGFHRGFSPTSRLKFHIHIRF